MFMASVFWQDSGGRERETRIPSTAGAPTVFADILNLSAAFCTGQIESAITAVGLAPATGVVYDDVGYQCAIDTHDIFANNNRIFLPAPSQAVCLADGINLDPLNPTVLALGAFAIGTLASTISGSPVTGITPGWVFRGASGIRETFTVSPTPVDALLREIVWVDCHGNTCATRLFGVTSPHLVMIALHNCSNAGLVEWWESIVLHPAYVPPASIYNGVGDTAALTYTDTAGNHGTLLIPAPVASMFYPDGETIDLAAPVLAPLLASGAAELAVRSSGAPLAAWVGGRRRPAGRGTLGA